MQPTIITSNLGHGYASGDVLEIKIPDRRLWKRLWHFIIDRRPPMKIEYVNVKAVTSKTTLTVN